jgi:cell fate (sporulation/competence/biofilm development) regulator YlbF (YheA/YmcA/DUF963 family)
MLEVRTQLDELKKELQTSEAVVRYHNARTALEQYPEKNSRVQEFRKKNFRLQTSKENIDLFAELEQLEREYEDVYRDPVTAEYLASEVAVCRILQQIGEELVKCLDFDIDFRTDAD